MGKAKISIIEVEYTDQVIIHAMIPLELKEQIRKKITEGTNGTAMFEWQESVNFAVLEGEVITLYQEIIILTLFYCHLYLL